MYLCIKLLSVNLCIVENLQSMLKCASKMLSMNLFVVHDVHEWLTGVQMM